MSVVTLGYASSSKRSSSTTTTSSSGGNKSELQEIGTGATADGLYPLAKLSCHLLLVLTTQSVASSTAQTPSLQPWQEEDRQVEKIEEGDDEGSLVDAVSPSRSIFRDLGANPYRDALLALTPECCKLSFRPNNSFLPKFRSLLVCR